MNVQLPGRFNETNQVLKKLATLASEYEYPRCLPLIRCIDPLQSMWSLTRGVPQTYDYIFPPHIDECFLKMQNIRPRNV